VNLTTSTLPKILYADDDQDDLAFLKESFAKAQASMVCTSDGEEAVNWLNSVDDEALPMLIILDLNMPRWDGRHTLKYLKSNLRFAQIPVVILSTSQNQEDKEECTRLGAVSYLEKPNHFNGYKEIVENCMPLINCTSKI
jgi:CheY-like chemotaxis protein